MSRKSKTNYESISSAWIKVEKKNQNNKNKNKEKKRKSEEEKNENNHFGKEEEQEEQKQEIKKFSKQNFGYPETFRRTADARKTQFGNFFNSLQIVRYSKFKDSITYFKIDVDFHLLDEEIRELLVGVIGETETGYAQKQYNKFHAEVVADNFEGIDVLPHYSPYYIGISIGYSQKDGERHEDKNIEFVMADEKKKNSIAIDYHLHIDSHQEIRREELVAEFRDIGVKAYNSALSDKKILEVVSKGTISKKDFMKLKSTFNFI